jgi:hypothetical protein
MQISNIKINNVNANLNCKSIVFRGNNNRYAFSNDDENYVKISKNQNLLNNIMWIFVGIGALFGIFKAISNNQKIPKL